jgi:hypothetical protein
MGVKSYKRRKIGTISISIIILLSCLIMIIPLGAMASDEPQVLLTLWTGDDDSLSPCDMDPYELKVRNATREGLLGYGVIPYDSDLWREVGTWSTEPVLRDMEIINDASCYVLLKDINGSEADIRIRFFIDGGQIGDTIILENEQVGAEPGLYSGSTGTTGTTISEGSQFQVQVDVRVVSESCYFIGGYLGTRIEFDAKPIKLSAIEYYDGEITATVKESFGVGLEDLTIQVKLSGDDVVDFTLTRDGADIFVDFNRFLTDGSYSLFLTIEYSGGIIASPNKVFTIDSAGQISDDDDDDDDVVADDDDDDYWYGDDDDDPQPDIELLSFSECERYYTDDAGDDIAYIANFDEELNMRTDVNIGNDRPIDITYVDVQRNGDDLEITVGVSGSLGFLSYVSAYFVNSDFSQPKPEMNDRFEEYPDYQPPNSIATNSLAADMPYWGATYDAEGSIVRIKGSLGDLMEMGLGPDFEVFVLADEIELEEEGDEIVSIYYVDYAGHHAYTITEADRDRVNKGSDDSLSFMEEYIPYILASGLLAIAIIIVIVVIVVKGKTDPSR